IIPTYVTQIAGGTEFLEKYPGVVLLNNVHSTWIIIYYTTLVVAAILILGPLLVFLFLNAFTGFKAVHSGNYSKKTRKVHITLLRASILQVMLLLLSAFIPVFLLIGSLLIERMVIDMTYMQCVLNFYPFFDNLVI